MFQGKTGEIAEDARQAVDGARNGSDANEVVLPSFEPTVRMPLMMAYDRNADAAGDFPEKEMIREALQIDPPPVSPLEMEPSWIGCSLVDERVQLLPELVAEAVVDTVIVPGNS
jgi:hypothetical protein